MERPEGFWLEELTSLGNVVHDYLQQSSRQPLRINKGGLAT
jgi:hypothetical protein